MTKGGGRAGEAERVESVPGDATRGAAHGKQGRLETRLAEARALETKRRRQAAEAIETGRKVKKRGRELDEAATEVTRLEGRLDRLRGKHRATATPTSDSLRPVATPASARRSASRPAPPKAAPHRSPSSEPGAAMVPAARAPRVDRAGTARTASSPAARRRRPAAGDTDGTSS